MARKAKSNGEQDTKTSLATVTTTTLDTAASGPPAVIDAAGGMSPAAEAFLKEAKGPREQPARVPIIGIDHKEGNFVLPSGLVVPQVSGYPVYYFHTRRFYKTSPRAGEKGKPPDCWSGDCIAPSADSLDRQSDICATCANNQFGTARDGRSKACGTFTWIFLLNPQYGSPPLAVLVAPSSSLRALVGTRFSQGYFAQCASRHGVYEIVWSTFRLSQQGDPRNVQYSVLEPQMGDACTDVEQVKKIALIRNKFLEVMNSLRGQTATVPPSSDEE
jgi:hypothetical protein